MNKNRMPLTKDCNKKARKIACSASYNNKIDRLRIYKDKKEPKCLQTLQNHCNIRPQDVEWLHNNKVFVCGINHKMLNTIMAYQITNYDDIGTEGEFFGSANCYNQNPPFILISDSPSIDSRDRSIALIHEIGHCKEGINRGIKELPRENLFGGEKRAVKFEDRMIKRGVV